MINKFLKSFAFLLLVAIAIIWILPLILTITNSFMSEREIVANYSTKPTYITITSKIKTNFIVFNLIPKKVSLGQYKEVLMYQPSYLILLLNSIKLTLPVVIGNSIISLLSAYGFYTWKFKYKYIVMMIYVTVMLMPLQAVLVPNYVIAEIFKIKESYLAIILPGIFAPFGTFLMSQSMQSLPMDSLEAARVDNANSVQIFFYIVFPQMKAGLAALGMLTFIEYWNIVDQAVVFIREYYRQPLSVFLSKISSDRLGVIFGASCIYMFFPLWFLLIGQKNLEKGIELSGIK